MNYTGVSHVTLLLEEMPLLAQEHGDTFLVPTPNGIVVEPALEMRTGIRTRLAEEKQLRGLKAHRVVVAVSRANPRRRPSDGVLRN
jgi:hypothetical protein